MPYYIAGVSGEAFTDATLHTTRDCPELDDPSRPLAESSAGEENGVCGECVANAVQGALSDANAGGGESPEIEAKPGETICSCDVGDACDLCFGRCPAVKQDGAVCGRDRPCPYHDD
jgi:hypothetical protein